MARGSVIPRRHKDGKTVSWSIKYRTATGRQKWETIGPSKKDAERALAKRLHEIETGTFREVGRLAFAEMADRWFSHHVEIRLRPSTANQYRSDYDNYLAPLFGAKPLQSLTTADVNDFVVALKASGRTNKTVNKVLGQLKSMLEFAVDNQLVQGNVAKPVKGLPEQKSHVRVPSHDEVRRLLEAVPAEFFLFFCLAVFTGLRQGELFGLQWEDIDWQNSALHVRRAVYKRQVVRVKSDAGLRRVDLGPQVLERMRAARPDESATGFIFVHDDGGPSAYNSVYRDVFLQALACADLPHMRFYDLRHAYASLQIDDGVNIKYLQVQMGHASIQTTIDTYGHLLPDTASNAVRLEGTVLGERPLADLQGRPRKPNELGLVWQTRAQRDAAIEDLWRHGRNWSGLPMTQGQVAAAVGVSQSYVT